MNEVPWIGEEQVAASVSLAEAIDIVEKGFEAQAHGDIAVLEKIHAGFPGGSLHALGAAGAASGFAAVKSWAYASGSAEPLLVLFDVASGALRAVVEATALSLLRTAAVSAVATRWLAPPEASDLAVIGTGRQAFAQVAAVAHVRRLRRVRVFSPNPAHRSRLVAQIRSELRRDVIDAGSVEEAVAGAPLVTLATRATTPLLERRMLADAAHVNAIGAISPERAEIARDVLESARCVVDDAPAARRLSRELGEALGSSEASWERIETLAQVVAQRRPPAGGGITVFKALGTGVADLALGIEVYYRIRRAGGGLQIARRALARPRLLPGGVD